MSQVAIEFDHRSDGGPKRVGPFRDRRAAEAHLDLLRGPGWESESSIVPLATEHESARHRAVAGAPRP